MDSDCSELTEVSSDEEPLASTARTKKAAVSSSKDGLYKIRNSLKPGRTVQYTAYSLFEQLQEGDINLNPDYQRDVVWTDNKQIGLIDSIFRNFYVPPIIFAVTIEDDGTEKRVCIDGKQRLTSIQRFLKGEIPHRDSVTGERYWYTGNVSGPKRRLLPNKLRTQFKNKQIVCVEYSDLAPDLEREVFQRVQMGIALSTAEKLQALSGSWPDFIREIITDCNSTDGIFSVLDMDLARGRDFMNLSQAVFCIDQLPNHTHPSALPLERWLKKGVPSNVTMQRLRNTFSVFKVITQDKQLRVSLQEPKRVAPVEFIMTSVLIAMFKDKFSLSQLSEAIGILRRGVRKIHNDVRMNAKVAKTMINILAKLKLSDLKQVPGAPVASQVNTLAAPPSGSQNTAISTLKRKRVESTDDREEDGNDEDEYKPKPKTRIPKTTNPSKQQQQKAFTGTSSMTTSQKPSQLGFNELPALPPGHVQLQSPSQPQELPRLTTTTQSSNSAVNDMSKQKAAQRRHEPETVNSNQGATWQNTNTVVAANGQHSGAPINLPLSATGTPLESALLSNQINRTHSIPGLTSIPYPTPPLISQDSNALNGSVSAMPISEIRSRDGSVMSNARSVDKSPGSWHHGHDSGRYRTAEYSNRRDDHREDERDRDPRQWEHSSNRRDDYWMEQRDRDPRQWEHPRDTLRDTRDWDYRDRREHTRSYSHEERYNRGGGRGTSRG